MAASGWFKAFGFGEALIRWVENSPNRLRKSLLEATLAHYDLVKNKRHRGKYVRPKECKKWMTHYGKQIDVWRTKI